MKISAVRGLRLTVWAFEGWNSLKAVVSNLCSVDTERSATNSHGIRGHTECPRRNGQNFGRVFLNYTDITRNTYIQSWTVTEIMAIEKCGLLGCPRTVRRPWRHTHPLLMPGNEKPLANSVMQWPWRDNGISCGLRKVLGNPKDNYDVSAHVFVVQFNGFMSLTS